MTNLVSTHRCIATDRGRLWLKMWARCRSSCYVNLVDVCLDLLGMDRAEPRELGSSVNIE